MRYTRVDVQPRRSTNLSVTSTLDFSKTIIFRARAPAILKGLRLEASLTIFTIFLHVLLLTGTFTSEEKARKRTCRNIVRTENCCVTRNRQTNVSRRLKPEPKAKIFIDKEVLVKTDFMTKRPSISSQTQMN